MRLNPGNDGESRFLERKRRVLLLLALLFFCLNGLNAIGMRRSVFAANAASSQKIQKVHTIYWKAKVHSTVSYNLASGNVTIPAGTEVLVLDRNYSYGKASLIRYNDRNLYVANSRLTWIEDMTTIEAEGDYNRATKEWFVNKKCRLSSRTQYLVWVSLDKQRVNVFEGKKGSWKLTKWLLCSTGAAETPTKTGLHKVSFKREYVDSLHNYVEFSGSGFHAWPGGGMEKTIGKHTASHGCTRLTHYSSKWFYDTIPVGTTVYFF